MSLNQGTMSFRKFYLSRGSRVTCDAGSRQSNTRDSV